MKTTHLFIYIATICLFASFQLFASPESEHSNENDPIVLKCNYQDVEGEWEIFDRDLSFKDHIADKSILTISREFSVGPVDFYEVTGSVFEPSANPRNWVGYCNEKEPALYTLVGQFDLDSDGKSCLHAVQVVRVSRPADMKKDEDGNEPKKQVRITSELVHSSSDAACAKHIEGEELADQNVIHKGHAHGGGN